MINKMNGNENERTFWEGMEAGGACFEIIWGLKGVIDFFCLFF